MPNDRLEVLISCMNQSDNAIVRKTNIRSNVLVINQCNIEKVEEYNDSYGNHVRFIHSKERGLSKSRNMGLKFAKSEICLLCDDDEIFDSNYVSKVLSSFDENPKADLVCFALKGVSKKFFKTKKYSPCHQCHYDMQLFIFKQLT